MPSSLLSYSLFPYALAKLPSSIDAPCLSQAWRVFISPLPINPSLYTRHKTTDRSHYDQARSHIRGSDATRGVTDEILLVNFDNEIMEGSISTPYFWRNNEWVTPPADAGGNVGTTRRWALETKISREAIVHRSSVNVGEAIWLSNGARGFGWGRIEEV